MTKATEVPPRRSQGRPSRRRSELERLLDLTVLGPTHPELGTCWRFTGRATTPYGRRRPPCRGSPIGFVT